MSIVIVGMLDEREEALSLLKKEIEADGFKTLIVDISIGVGGIKPGLKAHIGNDEVAEAGGSSIEEIKAMLSTKRAKATSKMAEGLQKKLLDILENKTLEGVVAVGGMTGTFISINALKALPFGVPKLLVSSTAAMPAYAKKLSEFLGVRDITVMNTVVDTVGMNPLVASLMRNAAGAICGMARHSQPIESEKGISIALTEFGFCDEGAHLVREILEERDMAVISFHATGLGDRAAEDLVSQGLFDVFIDLVPAGLSEHILGGNRDPGPNRLEGAVKTGIPYILSPCGFDMLSCGPIERKEKDDPLWKSRNLYDRKLFLQDAMRVQARTSPDEMVEIAQAVANRLNLHKNKRVVKFVVPLKGFSSLSKEGGPLHDPEADMKFLEELKRVLNPEIEIIEVDSHINTREFANSVVEALERSLKALR